MIFYKILTIPISHHVSLQKCKIWCINFLLMIKKRIFSNMKIYSYLWCIAILFLAFISIYIPTCFNIKDLSYIYTIKRHVDAFFDYMLDSHHESYNFISISKTISANVTRFIPLVDILFTTKTYSESFSFPFSVLLTYFCNHWDLQKCYLWANIQFEFVSLLKTMILIIIYMPF